MPALYDFADMNKRTTKSRQDRKVLSVLASLAIFTRLPLVISRHVVQGRGPPIVADSTSFVCLQSRYHLDEAQESLLNSFEGAKSEGLVPWMDRKTCLSHVMASCLTLSLFGTLAYDRIFRRPIGRIWPFLFGLLYLSEAAFCSTRRYLSNMLSPADVLGKVYDLTICPPQVRWKVECYHYRRGHHRDESHKRITHRSSRDFVYSEWRDVTDKGRLIQAMEYSASQNRVYFVKLTFVKLLTFTDPDTLQAYRAQKNLFFEQERGRDQYTSMQSFLEVENFKPKLLAVRTVVAGPGTGKFRLPSFWFYTLLGLTVPYRIWFSRRCDTMEVVLAKEVTV